MRSVEDYRRDILPLLPKGAFLRLDRGSALFVTDAPRLEPGFGIRDRAWQVRQDNGLLYITPVFDGIPADERQAFAASLKLMGERRQKLLRQRLALNMRLKKQEEAHFLSALLDETEESDYEA